MRRDDRRWWFSPYEILGKPDEDGRLQADPIVFRDEGEDQVEEPGVDAIAGEDQVDNQDLWLQIGMQVTSYDLHVAVGAEDLFRMPEGIYIATAASLMWARHGALNDLVAQMVLVSKTRGLDLPDI